MLTTVYTNDFAGKRVRFPKTFLDDAQYTKSMEAFVIVCADLMPYLSDGRVVLTTRRNKPANYVWEFGGRVLPGETYTEAAVRKMKQETGLTIHEEALRLLGCPRYFWPNRQQEPQDVPCDCLVFTYAVQIAEADIATINAGLDPKEYVSNSARAYTKAELQKELEAGNLHPATLALFDEIFRR